jgi:Tfp pilus assembly protein PilO
MDPKLVVLILLVGLILGLSYLGSGGPMKSARGFTGQRRRKLDAKWRKS